MHVHIATVGTNEIPITRVLNKVSAIDKLYLLYGSKDSMTPSAENGNRPAPKNSSVNCVTETNNAAAEKEKSAREWDTPSEAADAIEKKYASSIPKIIKIKVPGQNFNKIVESIYDIYDEESGKGVKFSINITGGRKVMTAAAVYSLYYTHATLYYAGTEGKTEDEKIIQINPVGSVDLSKLKPKTKAILKYIYDTKQIRKETEPLTTTSIVDYSKNNNVKIMGGKDASMQNIGYQLKVLKGYGLIDYEDVDGDERKKSIVITEGGCVLASRLNKLSL